MATIEDKYPDSPRKVDIKALCTDNRFGTEVNFAAAVKPLERMISDIIELEDLDYSDKLTNSETNSINGVRGTILRFVDEIKNFSIGSSPNPAEQRNQIVARIENYYQNSFANQIRQPLIYLKDQVKKTAKDEELLTKLVSKTEAINTELEERLNKIKQQEEKLNEDQKSLAAGRGIVSSQYLSSKFNFEAVDAEEKANSWLFWIKILSFILVAVIIGLFLVYVFVIRKIIDDNTLKIEYGIYGITLVASIFFFLRIVLRNYNIEKHSAGSNRHRANVASTIENLLAVADRDQGLQDALLKEASVAMFNPGSTGYLDKEQMEVSTPVKEVITTLIK